ncbi:hypothetical protein DBR37_03265 [Herminiimonas sp. KBW02]|uniref:TniQ family protein n=1 Tax=Herminiimonas sp. KBW02 TaxID=2153363 RepID=UPI000F5A9006|nr:TniQ family protein [Herminiimonas sp. KBW02]RQO37222.1 hypothetical protein DBR37_03265 [Herminiimonas sp. KBW02]
MKRSTLHPIKAEQGESLRGYLLRLSTAYGWPGMGWLKELPEEVRRLRTMIGVSVHGRIPSWLRERGAALLSGDLSHHHYLGKLSRCCPDCLIEYPFWRIEWEHIFYTVCHVHRHLLRDQCPECNAYLTWDRPSLTHCRCGSSILSWRSADVLTDESQLCAAISKRILYECGLQASWEGNTEIDTLKVLNLHALVRLIFTFGTYVDRGKNLGTGLAKFSKVSDAHKMTRLTSIAITNWPFNFYEFLKENISFDLRTKTAKQFAKFSRLVRKQARKNGELDFIARELQDYLAKYGARLLDRRNSWATREQRVEQRYMPGTLAAKILGVKRAVIADLVQKEILVGYSIKTNKRSYLVIERSSLNKAKYYRTNMLTFTDVIAILNLSRRRTNDLVGAGILDETRERGIRIFCKTQVQKLVETLSIPKKLHSPENTPISMGSVLKSHIASGKEFVLMMRAILSGDISTIGTPESKDGIAGVLLDRTEYYDWRSRFTLCQGDEQWTLPQLAKKLGFKQQVIYHLAGSGLLQSLTQKSGRRKYRVVTLAALNEFEDKYISSAQLAKLRNTSPKFIIKNLMTEGIVPISGPSIDGCRQYFYKKNDVALMRVL